MTLKQLLAPSSALFLEKVCSGSLQPTGLLLHTLVPVQTAGQAVSNSSV